MLQANIVIHFLPFSDDPMRLTAAQIRTMSKEQMLVRPSHLLSAPSACIRSSAAFVPQSLISMFMAKAVPLKNSAAGDLASPAGQLLTVSNCCSSPQCVVVGLLERVHACKCHRKA